MTDLRSNLVDFESAARRILERRQPPPTRRQGIAIHLTSDRHLGQLVRHLRRQQGRTLDDVAEACRITRKGLCNRELHSRAMTAGALIETLHALGYDVIAVPSAATTDRRTA